MTKEELAAEIDGNEYGSETTNCEARAKAAGLVVVFGYSDDNVELRGAIDDEVGAWNGTTLYFDKDGLLQNECNEDDCPYHEKAKKTAKTIKVIWHDNGSESGGFAWTFETDIPHATFRITEDGDPFCKGIVFSIKDL